ncbi:hypothetical protein Hypma_016555 [Hypsizygus marmoreus]|uniref:Uncharacterized protein n=1 Tax=Hypsizygus marmoreus TaxID=39966 RepID=A0A369IXV6_HYPMA|nr:hypothetical protein Hypma_016555 [Hypsizygus marmoreus]
MLDHGRPFHFTKNLVGLGLARRHTHENFPLYATVAALPLHVPVRQPRRSASAFSLSTSNPTGSDAHVSSPPSVYAGFRSLKPKGTGPCAPIPILVSALTGTLLRPVR